MEKAIIRKEYSAKRNALSPAEQSRLNDLLLIQFQRLELPFAQTIFNYVPMEHRAEPNTYLFSHYLSFIIPGLTLAYPVTDIKNSSMEAYAVHEDTEFQLRQFGLIEPISTQLVDPREIDIIIVPLLAADTSGYRVGYGKGIYDRYISRCREDVFKIGFSFFPPLEQISDININDIPLNVLVSPEKIYYF
ncbi:MAG: 5-formyltetrahydrofolate cyclo-ligase [Sphingobacteriales bacterium]|nr:MAG: 5-formyltetrahydrofolate cyclo-ligase [Sphingobacteriales bacterium]